MPYQITIPSKTSRIKNVMAPLGLKLLSKALSFSESGKFSLSII